MKSKLADAFASRPLLGQHRELILRSAISDAIADARGYWSVTMKVELAELGFGRAQQLVPGLLIPIHNVHGEIATYQLRPDKPRIKDGKPIKYETPRGSKMVLDVPPGARAGLGNPGVPLFVTEGARKADSAVTAGLCCVALLGVWNWRGTNEHGGQTALADFELIALKGRTVCLAFDSDVTVKWQVAAALTRLKHFLESRGARVQIIYFPAAKDGSKVGLDDFLAAGASVDDLLGLATGDSRPSSKAPREGSEEAAPYRMSREGIFVEKRSAREDADYEVQVTNFRAKITAEVTIDNGAEQQIQFAIEIESADGRKSCVLVPANEFGGMHWCVAKHGTSAVVFAVPSAKEHARTAIQLLSKPTRRLVYAHTGWRELDGHQVYVHGAGAIGVYGLIPNVEVDLPIQLQPMRFTSVPTGDERQAAVRRSVKFLALGPLAITCPLFGAVHVAPLGGTDFSIHLFGETGAFKTEVAALCQQFYGLGFDARHLPGSWSSTENFLEGLAFAAKDALLVIDDFVAAAADQGYLQARADRVLRAVGNQSGRGRMAADGTLRRSMPPRALIISTGEDLPRGHSLRSRSMLLNIRRGDISSNALSEMQEFALAGDLAASMAAYIRWLAPRLREHQARIVERQASLRRAAAMSSAHRRTASIVASLQVGLELFLEFAVQVGAVDAQEAKDLLDRGSVALHEAAATQSDHHQSAEPCAYFVRLLSDLFATGRVHVASREGGAPPFPLAAALGWRTDAGSPNPRPLGERIGWVDEKGLYLLAEISFAAAQKLAREQGDVIPVSVRTLSDRLASRGYLLGDTVRGGDRRWRVRRRFEGVQRTVLWLRPDALSATEGDDQPTAGVRAPGNGGAPRRMSGHSGHTATEAMQDEPSEVAGPLAGTPPGTGHVSGHSRNDAIADADGELAGLAGWEEGGEPGHSTAHTRTCQECAPLRVWPEDAAP